jgi:predicted RecB family endonuclease
VVAEPIPAIPSSIAGLALSELIEAIRKYRKLAEKTPLTLQGSDFAQTVEELNKAIDRAEGLMLR